MPKSTKISWTDATWNPTHGCSHASEGCRFCYAETLSLRYGHTKEKWSHQNSEVNFLLKPHKLREPYSWKEPKRVFVNSMSDLFHPLMPEDYLKQIFDVMSDLPQHRFQVLTKRPDKAAEWDFWPDNVWMGATVENRKSVGRIDAIRSCGARVKFLSCEPLLEDLGYVDLSGIDWVIAGGESGSHLSKEEWKSRWMDHAWSRTLRDSCVRDGVAFFFKQSSGVRTEMGVALEESDGSYWIWQQYPDFFRDPVEVPHQISGSQLGEYITEAYSDQVASGEIRDPDLFESLEVLA